MSHGRVVLIGAVHESIAAFDAILAHDAADFAGCVTLDRAAAAKVSGAVDLAGRARRHGVHLVEVSDVNEASSVEAIRALRPDLLVVVGWTRLIGDQLLALPPRGVVGFHASLLPHNRGRAPVNWAILRGEDQTGNTMMLLDAGVDTGRIVDQRATPIHADDTCDSVYERVADLGARMLVDNLGPLLDGTARARPQDDAAATTLPKRVPAMGVVSWLRGARELHDWARAQTLPYPGAFTRWEDREVMVWSTVAPAAASRADGAAEPGTVVAIGPHAVRVATGDGVLDVTRLGDRGGVPLPAHEWAAAAGLREGSRFREPPAEVVRWSLGLGPRPAEEWS